MKYTMSMMSNKEELKDISLQFRGSSNQRIIDVKERLNK